MEEHAIAAELQYSRAQLRALLLPNPETGRIEADVFPRSAVMRLLFNPSSRGMIMTAIGAIGMLSRRRRAAGGSPWGDVLHSLGDVVGSGRR